MPPPALPATVRRRGENTRPPQIMLLLCFGLCARFLEVATARLGGTTDARQRIQLVGSTKSDDADAVFPGVQYAMLFHFSVLSSDPGFLISTRPDEHCAAASLVTCLLNGASAVNESKKGTFLAPYSGLPSLRLWEYRKITAIVRRDPGTVPVGFGTKQSFPHQLAPQVNIITERIQGLRR